MNVVLYVLSLNTMKCKYVVLVMWTKYAHSRPICALKHTICALTCSARLFAEQVSENSSTMYCLKKKYNLKPIKVFKELQHLMEKDDGYTKV